MNGNRVSWSPWKAHWKRIGAVWINSAYQHSKQAQRFLFVLSYTEILTKLLKRKPSRVGEKCLCINSVCHCWKDIGKKKISFSQWRFTFDTCFTRLLKFSGTFFQGTIQVPLSAEIHETPTCATVLSCQSPAACQWSFLPGWHAWTESAGKDAHLLV